MGAPATDADVSQKTGAGVVNDAHQQVQDNAAARTEDTSDGEPAGDLEQQLEDEAAATDETEVNGEAE